MIPSSAIQTYDLADLADALLQARRFEHAADPLRDHFTRRGQAFERAFGLVRAQSEDRRAGALLHLLESTLRSMLSFSSPTAGFLEAPRELVEFAQRFTPEIERANAELDRVLRAMLFALLDE